ncbi:MAG: hypothetical protein HOE90_22430 [Bacteriovoracaceae bacterium]|jgi:hypothetical protein|nr:hypothetical protein [Bacteriovoracaceae bacterium]
MKQSIGPFIALSLILSGGLSAAEQKKADIILKESRTFKMVTPLVLAHKEDLLEEERNPWITVFEGSDKYEAKVITPVNSAEVTCTIKGGKAGDSISETQQSFSPIAGEIVQCRQPITSKKLYTDLVVSYELKKVSAKSEDVDQELHSVGTVVKEEIEKDQLSSMAVLLMEASKFNPIADFSREWKVHNKDVEIVTLKEGEILIYRGAEGQWTKKTPRIHKYSQREGALKPFTKGFLKDIFSSDKVTFGPDGDSNRLARRKQSRLPFPEANPYSVACGQYDYYSVYKGLAFTGANTQIQIHQNSELKHVCAVNDNARALKLNEEENGFTIKGYLFKKSDLKDRIDAMVADLEASREMLEREMNEDNRSEVTGIISSLLAANGRMFKKVEQSVFDISMEQVAVAVAGRDEAAAGRVAAAEEAAEQRRVELEAEAAQALEETKRKEAEAALEMAEMKRRIHRLEANRYFPESETITGTYKTMKVTLVPQNIDGKVGYQLVSERLFDSPNSDGEISVEFKFLPAEHIFNTQIDFSDDVESREFSICPAWLDEGFSNNILGKITELSIKEDGSGVVSVLKSHIRPYETYKCTSAKNNFSIGKSTRRESYEFCYVGAVSEEGTELVVTPDLIRAVYDSDNTAVNYTKTVMADSSEEPHGFFTMEPLTYTVSEGQQHVTGQPYCVSADNIVEFDPSLLVQPNLDRIEE